MRGVGGEAYTFGMPFYRAEAVRKHTRSLRRVDTALRSGAPQQAGAAKREWIETTDAEQQTLEPPFRPPILSLLSQPGLSTASRSIGWLHCLDRLRPHEMESG